MGEMTDEQQMWKEFFDDFDKDGSGKLCREECIKAMNVLGQNPTEKDIDDWMKDIDRDGDDATINFDEFCTYMQHAPNADETLNLALDEIAEEDGRITREKLKGILQLSDGDDETIEEVLNAADVNKDGILDKQELINFMQCKNQAE